MKEKVSGHVCLHPIYAYNETCRLGKGAVYKQQGLTIYVQISQDVVEGQIVKTTGAVEGFMNNTDILAMDFSCSLFYSARLSMKGLGLS